MLGGLARLGMYREGHGRADSRWSVLADLELEGLKSSTNGGTARAFPSRTLFSDKNLHTCRTDATDAFRASVRVSKEGRSLAGGAVNLCVLGAVAIVG